MSHVIEFRRLILSVVIASLIMVGIAPSFEGNAAPMANDRASLVSAAVPMPLDGETRADAQIASSRIIAYGSWMYAGCRWNIGGYWTNAVRNVYWSSGSVTKQYGYLPYIFGRC